MIAPGNKLKQYEILELIGKGGMGEVYLALDTVLNRKVAIKFLSEEMQKDARGRERLLREAKAAASLDHPFICKIYEVGEIGGQYFFVMEYVEGKDLRAKLDEGTLPMRDSLQMALEVAEALEEAHKKGIVHRDLKPSNIMITPQGHIKVMDFGLAKHIVSEGEADFSKTLTQTSLTEQGAVVGTIAYMSPEQARGEAVDTRSDIFSLGIIIYEMTTGRYPFSQGSPLETLTSILRDATPPPHIRPKAMNPVLRPILHKALAKEPENRYQDIKDLIDDIRKLQREFLGGVRLIFRGWPMIVAGIVIIAILITGSWLLFRRPAVSTSGTGITPISVLVADFQNLTGDPIFAGALEKNLSIYLEGASFISVRNRQEALRAAAKLSPRTKDVLDEDLAQLVSRSEGINVVVTGLVEASDKGYVIRVWARDPVSSNKIYDDSETIKTKDEVLKAVDRLAAKLRSKLGNVPADSIQALTKETFTTTSLEAMKAFARGQELDDQGKQEEAISEYLKAIDNDPNFGRAYASLAMMYYNLGQYNKAEDYFQKAMKLIDTMTDREKYRTRGIYYLMVRDYKKAIDEYNALLEQFPGDYVAHANLALAYFFARNMPKAMEEGRLDVKYNPQGVHSHYNMSWYALSAGDFQTAEDEARKAVEIEPGFKRAYVTLALAQLAKDQPAQANVTYRQVEALDSFGASLAAAGLSDLAVYEGRLMEAIKILEKGIAFDLKNKMAYDAADKYIMLAQTYLLQGKNEPALEVANNALKISQEGEILFSVAQIYLNAGEEDKARALAGELSKKLQPEPLAYAKLIGGELSRQRGDIGNAVNLFHEANSLLDTWLGRFFLGRAYFQAKDYTAASSEFETCLKRRGEAGSVFLNDLPTYRYLPPVYYYLARTQEGLGSDAAAESFQKFLKIKAKDDGSDSMVKEVLRR
jgi:serine/threonine protein kinase/tetratricopeptide (TPR) repeat protein